MRITFYVGLGLTLLLGGCWPFSGFVHDETLAGPYRLVAVDTMDDMALCRPVGDSGDCAGDGLPDHTIFAAGADDNHIVLARHPRNWPDAANRDVTEYYVVVRRSDEAERGPAAIRGPFSADQFARERARLRLPEFSRTFEQLR